MLYIQKMTLFIRNYPHNYIEVISMIRKKAIIYCFANSQIYSGDQRAFLDVCFFRLLAYAQAHEMQVTAYYEDTQKWLGGSLRMGLIQLQLDLLKKPCDAILVIDSNQLPKGIASKYSKKVISIKITERARLENEI